MATLDDAVKTQVRNIEQATGRSMEAWVTLVKASGAVRHTEIVARLKTKHGFSHGNASGPRRRAIAAVRTRGALP